MASEDQKYEYTVGSYLNNPIGAGAASGPQRQAVLNSLRDQYSQLAKRHKVRVFQVGSSILFAVDVPSSSFDNFHYDVVIEFLNAKPGDDLRTKHIRIFSNSPSFTYTYAYVMNERELLIPYLRKLLPKEFYSDAPTKRNPDEIVNYEKTVVYAMFHILDNELMRGEVYRKAIQPVSKLKIADFFQQFDALMMHYKDLERAAVEKRKAERAAAKAKKEAALAAQKAQNAKVRAANVKRAQAAKPKRTGRK
jgi:hypothetical protein